MSGEGGRIRYADSQLDDVAYALCAAHPRASQYLEQAPALAALACQKMAGHITYGELDRFAGLVRDEPRLRAVCAALDAPAAVRKIGAVGLRMRHRAALTAVCRLDASTLAQVIPSDSQGVWLDGVNQWLRLAPRSREALAGSNVGWIARRLSEDLSRYEQVETLVDFLGRGGGALNERWSWQAAMAAVAEWHKRLGDEIASRRMLVEQKLAKSFDDVICTAQIPDLVVVDGLTFVALRTLRHLREEGAVMRHCVASYARDVKRGESTIVSVGKDGVRLATLEIGKDGAVRQLKAVCNQAVSAETRRTCEIYALQHWSPPVPA